MSDFKASLRSTTVEDEVFSGSGLDDMDSGGIYGGDETSVFTIEISSVGAQDAIKWKKDNGSYTTVNVSITAMDLSDGVTMIFGAITGHTLGDSWTILVSASGIDAVLSDDGETLTIIDHSNYTTNTESGHAEADFKDYRVLEGNFKRGDTEVVDITIDPHWNDDDSIAYSDSADTPIDKDRVWDIILITVPTYNATVDYEINDCTYFASTLWQTDADTTSGEEPGTSSKWSEIEKDDLPIKYRSDNNNVALIHLLMKCEDEKVYERHCEIKNLCADEFCKDPKAINIWKLGRYMRSIEIGVELFTWDKVDQDIEDATEICEKCTC